MQIIFTLALALSPLFADESLTKQEMDTLNELTKTLEARALEADRREDGAAVIIERTIASESPEPLAR